MKFKSWKKIRKIKKDQAWAYEFEMIKGNRDLAIQIDHMDPITFLKYEKRERRAFWNFVRRNTLAMSKAIERMAMTAREANKALNNFAIAVGEHYRIKENGGN